jgi:autotransporter-associated beta strand protein
MRIMQHLWSCEIKKIIPSDLRLRAPAYFLATAILMLLLAAAGTAFAGSATWNLNPTSGEWHTAENWTPPTIPNGPADTATFGVSNGTFVYSDYTGFEVNGIVFNAGASAFTFLFENSSFNHLFTISGVGITNNSGITQNFALVDGGDNVGITFKNSATAGDLTVFTLEDYICYVEFQDTSTAGNATLIANSDAAILFTGDSTGGTARVEVGEGVYGNGHLDISAHNAPGVMVGSIEGTGAVFLGANNLTVGSNNLSTTFSGVIQDDGSLTKIGAGTLELTGWNHYDGGTTIERGELVVNSMIGSGTGSGAVQVNAGTLVGRGAIAGAVTVGTGSGAGAGLAPGKRKAKPGTLTIRSTLTCNSDATYEVSLNTNDAIADQVVANGITISGAQFSLVDHGGFALTHGTVFTVIDNTSGTPITGTFANLADGSIFTVNGNTFQASYEGGTGNDLTLTVVP